MFFSFTVKAKTEFYTYGHTLSLHDARPICLTFNQGAAHLHIPFAAITAFVDPAVNFALQFQAQADIAPEPHEEAENDAPQGMTEDGSNVVTVDFGKKK